MARVNLDSNFFSDARILRLSEITNEKIYVTRGRLVSLYNFCYCSLAIEITDEEVNLHSHWNGPGSYSKHLLASYLAETQKDGKIRIKGVFDRIEYLLRQRERGRLGGIKSSRKGLKNKEKDSKQTLSERSASAKQPSSKSNPLTLTLNTDLTLNTKEGGEVDLPKKRKRPIQRETRKLNLQSIWNENCDNLPSCASISPSRQKKINARLDEVDDEGYWIKVAEKLNASEFCDGNNDKGWRATFDFFIKPDTHLKAIEGLYDNKEGKRSRSLVERRESRFKSQLEAIEKGTI